MARAEAHAGLAALVGTRIYFDELPQKPDYPAVTCQVISDLPAMRGGGEDPSLMRARIQVSAWSEDKREVIVVKNQIVACFQRWSGTEAGVTVDTVFFLNRVALSHPAVSDTSASGRGVYQQAVDFEFIYEG